jgi:hypothetical protein
MAGLTFLRVVGNDDLAAQDRQYELDAAMQDRQNQPVVLGLTAHIRECWDAARIAKKPIETIMLRALRQRGGEYEPDKLNQIRSVGGSEVYMMLTEIKCRAAESWLRDILMDQGQPPWDMQPTPLPELAPTHQAELEEAFGQSVVEQLQQAGRAPTMQEMQELREVVAQDYRFKLLQAAQNRADRMKDKINDQFAQGGWSEAFNDFLSDLVTFPAAFLKGPVVRRQRVLEYTTDESGATVVSAGERLAPEYERVDPFNIYPEPGVARLSDGYLFEHHPLTRTQLADLIGVPGYDDDAIRKVLEMGNGQSWISEDVELQKEELERKYYAYNTPTDTFDALEFWGKVSGAMLREWGLEEDEVPDEAKEYDANVWVVGNYVIKAVLNYDPLGEKPYAKSSFIKRPGSLWGSGIPEIIEDLQNICNAAARALVNNMGLASGPQVEVNIDRLPPNEDLTNMHPWKIWQVQQDPAGSSAPAVRFAQPDSRAGELMAVYDRFSRLADDHSGIPSYVYGDLDVQGAGRTASGLSMLMGSAGKGIRQVVMHIDADIIYPIVHRQFVYNMRYDEDESIKGDVDIVPRGAVNLAVKETTNVRRVEFLNATANPVDMEIIGVEGRAAILREIAKGLQMPADQLVPSRDKMSVQMRQRAAAAATQMSAGGGGSPSAEPAQQQTNTVANQDTGQAV